MRGTRFLITTIQSVSAEEYDGRGGQYQGGAAPGLPPLVVALTDVIKPYARKIDYLARVRDGSAKILGNGYWCCQVVVLERVGAEVMPLDQELYSQEAPGFVSENDEILKSIDPAHEPQGDTVVQEPTAGGGELPGPLLSEWEIKGPSRGPSRKGPSELRSLYQELTEGKDFRRGQGRKRSVASVFSVYILVRLANLSGPVAAAEYAQMFSQKELRAIGAWKKPKAGHYVPVSKSTLHRDLVECLSLKRILSLN